MNTLYTIIGYTDPGNNQFVFQNVTKTAQMFMRKLLSHTVDNNRTRVYNFSPDGEMADIVCSYAQAYLNPFESTKQVQELYGTLSDNLGKNFIAVITVVISQVLVQNINWKNWGTTEFVNEDFRTVVLIYSSLR